MNKAKELAPRIAFTLAILAFIANILYIWNSPVMRNSWMGNDEYFFYRTTMNLPNLETTGLWLTEEKAPNPMAVDDYARGLFDRAYTTPIWIHPLLPNVVAYPVAMLFSDVAEQIQWLRLFDVVVIIVTVGLFLDVIRMKTNGVVASVSVFPMMVGRYLLANGIMFYNDLFMWLFFALAMWVITRRPHSRWVLPLIVATVLMKINAIVLLVPLLLYLHYQTGDKWVVAKVMVVSVLVFAGYLVVQAIVASDALYVLHHWSGLDYAYSNFGRNVLPYIWDYAVSWGLWISLPLLAAGIVIALTKRIKAFYGFAAFGVVTLLYSFGWGFYAYQVYPVMYASMFMVPLVGFNVHIERGCGE